LSEIAAPAVGMGEGSPGPRACEQQRTPRFADRDKKPLPRFGRIWEPADRRAYLPRRRSGPLFVSLPLRGLALSSTWSASKHCSS